MGEDPEHGEGPGHLWCIDPTKRGDVSPELVLQADGRVAPVRRRQAFNPWEQVFRVVPEQQAWEDLDKEKLSAEVRAEFEKVGVILAESAWVSIVWKSHEWLVHADELGDTKQFHLERTWTHSYAGYQYHLCGGKASTEKVVQNPNSAVVWHYGSFDQNGTCHLHHADRRFSSV